MAIWQLQDAKAHFSQVIEKAQSDGPQYITRHGKQRAVVISMQEYERISGVEDDALTRHLLTGPKFEDFRIERDPFVARECGIGDE